MQGLEEPRYRAAAMGLLALVAAVWGSQLCVDAVCDCAVSSAAVAEACPPSSRFVSVAQCVYCVRPVCLVNKFRA